MLEAVHMCWACHPAWPSGHLDAGSLGRLLAETSSPESGGLLSRQLPTRRLPLAPVPLGYCGRNRRFVLWWFFHIEQLQVQPHVAPRPTHPESEADFTLCIGYISPTYPSGNVVPMSESSSGFLMSSVSSARLPPVPLQQVDALIGNADWVEEDCNLSFHPLNHRAEGEIAGNVDLTP